MKNTLLLLLIPLFYSCETKPKPSTAQEFIDSINRAQKADSLTKETITKSINSAYFDDTIGMSSAPVRVIKAQMVEKEYTNRKDISLVYKNFSDKKVEAIRFAWYGLNAFGEPADMGSYGLSAGFGGGYTDDPLKPGKTDEGTWEISSKDGRKVVAAWVTEVVFSDGTKWKPNNKK